jgi:hypothetical protein
MTFDPLEQRGIPLDRQLRDWRELNVQPMWERGWMPCLMGR